MTNPKFLKIIISEMNANNISPISFLNNMLIFSYFDMSSPAFNFFYLIFFLELHDAFVLFDVDHDGRITETELKNVLNFLSIPASPAEVKKMIADADTDGNGTVEFNEFLLMMNRYSEKTANCPDAEMLEAFRVSSIRLSMS
ncbi:unnamed protein product [Hymenolepis diminuta]|uniref:EF-hand domain-containing protein n=1 Tax=Hymenolepis diminuta TaxID=6216 RepID=A0A3P7BHQ2_HYMDI|nr:unnamed protein product [Hymenolepis diminuta]